LHISIGRVSPASITNNPAIIMPIKISNPLKPIYNKNHIICHLRILPIAFALLLNAMELIALARPVMTIPPPFGSI
jgi:hypothetical protein